MGIESGAEYRFSAYVRTSGPKSIRATITDDAGHEIGSGTLQSFNSQWNRYETIIRATATSQHARLNLILDEPGQLDLDMVSLFPVDTFKAPPKRPAQGPRPTPRGHAPRLSALPRRLHR